MEEKYDDIVDPEKLLTIVTRIFNAPPEVVFELWTTPSHISKWWGPTGFKTTVKEMEVKVGGVWRYVMHGPDGIDYPNKITYHEVTKPKKLVYTHGWDNGEKPNETFDVVVTFEKIKDKTKLTVKTQFPSNAEFNRAMQIGAVKGLNETLDRLVLQLKIIKKRSTRDSSD